MRKIVLFYSFGLFIFGFGASPTATYAQDEGLEGQEIVSDVPAALISSKAPYVLVYDHLSGEKELLSNTGQVVDRWPADVTTVAGLPADRPLVVRVVNANSLLYTYSVSANVIRSKQMQTCSNLGRNSASLYNMQSLMGLVGSSAGVLELLPAIAGLEAPAMEEEFFDRGGDDGPSFTEVTLRRTVNNISFALYSYSDFLDQIGAFTDKLPQTLDEIAVRAEVRPITPMLDAVQADAEDIKPGLSRALEIPSLLSDARDEVRPQLGSLSLIRSALEEGGYRGQPDDDIVAEARELIQRIEGSEKRAYEAAGALQLLLHQIENALGSAEQSFNLSASKSSIRQISLQLAPTDQFPDALRLRAGSVQFYSEPTAGLLCQLSVGIAFLDEPPVYNVENGLVNKSTGSDSRIGVNLLLHVSSEQFPLVGGLVGIGLGDGNSPDLYAGGTLRLLHPIMINFGAVWQRTRRLPGGVSIGGEAPDGFDNDLLKKRYEPEFFFGLSFAR